MVNSINYRETLFKRYNLNPIRDKTTFEMFHKLRINIKAKTKCVYSNLGGGSHGHIGLVLTDA